MKIIDADGVFALIRYIAPAYQSDGELRRMIHAAFPEAKPQTHLPLRCPHPSWTGRADPSGIGTRWTCDACGDVVVSDYAGKRVSKPAPGSAMNGRETAGALQWGVFVPDIDRPVAAFQLADFAFQWAVQNYPYTAMVRPVAFGGG